MTTVTIGEKTGRNISGDDHGKVTHARINGSNKALCGTEPGRTASWSEYSVTMDLREAEIKAYSTGIITCHRCEKALYNYDTRPQWGCGSVR